jgi:hypothetical protein
MQQHFMRTHREYLTAAITLTATVPTQVTSAITSLEFSNIIFTFSQY